ncbi:MAG: ABC transporter ATP-binding protein [Caldilineaceae bacterium]
MSFSIGTTGGRGGGPGHMLRSMGGAKGEGRAFDWRVISRMLTFLQPHRAKMTVAFVLMLVVTALTLLTPYLVKVAIDQNITQGDVAGLTRTSLLIAAAFIGTYVATVGQRYLLSWVGQRVLATVRDQLVRHLQVLPLGYHDKHIVGVTISRVIGDVAVINELLSQGLITLMGDLLVLVGILAVMLSMSMRLALLTFSVLPIMLIATWIFSRHAKTAFRNVRARVAAVVGSLAEALTGIRVIKAYAQEDAEYARFEKINRVNREANIEAMSLSFVFLPSVEFLGVVATAVVLWFGGRSVGQGDLTLGIMVAFLAYVTRFFAPIQELSQLYTTMQAAMAGGERVIEMLDTEPAVADPADAAQMPPIRGRIELRDVTFAYEPDKPVLRGVNLCVQPGQTVALVGPTGAGKSSIANLISRFYDVTDGSRADRRCGCTCGDWQSRYVRKWAW